jgi:hypothetical protein
MLGTVSGGDTEYTYVRADGEISNVFPGQQHDPDVNGAAISFSADGIITAISVNGVTSMVAEPAPLTGIRWNSHSFYQKPPGGRAFFSSEVLGVSFMDKIIDSRTPSVFATAMSLKNRDEVRFDIFQELFFNNELQEGFVRVIGSNEEIQTLDVTALPVSFTGFIEHRHHPMEEHNFSSMASIGSGEVHGNPPWEKTLVENPADIKFTTGFDTPSSNFDRSSGDNSTSISCQF